MWPGIFMPRMTVPGNRRWPMAPDRTINVCEWHFQTSELARPDFDASDAIDFWDMTNRQDWHVCELSQAGISSRAYTPGPYSNREDLLYAFDRMIASFEDLYLSGLRARVFTGLVPGLPYPDQTTVLGGA